MAAFDHPDNKSQNGFDEYGGVMVLGLTHTNIHLDLESTYRGIETIGVEKIGIGVF